MTLSLLYLDTVGLWRFTFSARSVRSFDFSLILSKLFTWVSGYCQGLKDLFHHYKKLISPTMDVLDCRSTGKKKDARIMGGIFFPLWLKRCLFTVGFQLQHYYYVENRSSCCKYQKDNHCSCFTK